MKPLDLSDIDQVLRQVGVSEDLSLSPTFYLQLKKLQEEVKRKDWERRKYGHSLKRSQARGYKGGDRRGEWEMKDLEGMEPRELYLPDGTKLDQLKKSASETMLHLINATKEVCLYLWRACPVLKHSLLFKLTGCAARGPDHG